MPRRGPAVDAEIPLPPPGFPPGCAVSQQHEGMLGLPQGLAHFTGVRLLESQARGGRCAGTGTPVHTAPLASSPEAAAVNPLWLWPQPSSPADPPPALTDRPSSSAHPTPPAPSPLPPAGFSSRMQAKGSEQLGGKIYGSSQPWRMDS